MTPTEFDALVRLIEAKILKSLAIGAAGPQVGRALRMHDETVKEVRDILVTKGPQA